MAAIVNPIPCTGIPRLMAIALSGVVWVQIAVAKDRHRTLCRLCAEKLHDTPMAKKCWQKIDDVMHEAIDDHLARMHRLRPRRGEAPG